MQCCPIYQRTNKSRAEISRPIIKLQNCINTNKLCVNHLCNNKIENVYISATQMLLNDKRY